MKIAILESLGIPAETLTGYVTALEKKGHEVAIYERTADPDILEEECRGAEAVILANMPFPDSVILKSPDLRFIDVAFTGVDHIGMTAARDQGILVSNASGYSDQSVAELVLAMALSLLRNIPAVERRCREGGTKDGLVGTELRGKTVGIVGLGAIGSRTAELFHALGCPILAHTPHPRADAPDYIRYVSLAELMADSDIVTLHCPLKDSTRGLIHEDLLRLMKPTALLINAARGPVVDQDALAKALGEGWIAGAGIDVFETEPPLPADHPLLSAPHTLVTPHVAFATRESMLLRAEIVFGNMDAWLAGEPVHVVQA